MAAASAAEIKREIQQLEARLQRLHVFLAEVVASTANECKERKAAAKDNDPSAVVRCNQHISVLHLQYVTASKQRDQVRDRLAVLRQQAQ